LLKTLIYIKIIGMKNNNSTQIILDLIKSRKTSQAKVAGQLGITKQHLSAIMTGKYPAGKKTAIKLKTWSNSEEVSILELMGMLN
jgi:transcriptional regulator with XRE-family HTH domain